MRARVGDTIQKNEVSVYNFTIDRIKNSDGIEKLAVATLLDIRDGRRIFLTHGKRKLKEKTTVIFRSEEQPSLEIKIIEEPPYEFETETRKYILEKINLEESSVTVKRLGDGDMEPEVKQLFLKTTKKPKTTLKQEKSETEEQNQFFNFDF